MARNHCIAGHWKINDENQKEWIDEQIVPFSPEEEAIADIEQAQFETKQAELTEQFLDTEKVVALEKLTMAAFRDFLMSDESDFSAIRKSFREAKKNIDNATDSAGLQTLAIT